MPRTEREQLAMIDLALQAAGDERDRLGRRVQVTPPLPPPQPEPSLLDRLLGRAPAPVMVPTPLGDLPAPPPVEKPDYALRTQLRLPQPAPPTGNSLVDLARLAASATNVPENPTAPLEDLLHGMELYNRSVPQTIAGQRLLATLDEPGPGIRVRTLDPAQKDAIRAAYDREGYAGAWNEYKQRAGMGWAEELAGESLYDPTTYLFGAGLWGRGAQALGTRAPALAKVLRGAQAIEDAPGKAAEALLRRGMDAARRIPGVGQIVAPSGKGQVEQYSQLFDDMIREVESAGYNARGYRSVLGQVDQVEWPGSAQLARASERDAWKLMDGRVRQIKNPLVRLYALQAWDYANKAAARYGDEMAGELASMTYRWADPTHYADEKAVGWSLEKLRAHYSRARHAMVRETQRALGDALANFEEMAPKVALDPAQLQRLDSITNHVGRTGRILYERARRQIDGLQSRLQAGTIDDIAYRQSAAAIYEERNRLVDDLFEVANARIRREFPEATAQLLEGQAAAGITGRLRALRAQALGLPGVLGNIADEPEWAHIAREIPAEMRKVERDQARVAEIISPALDHWLQGMQPIGQVGRTRSIEEIRTLLSNLGIDTIQGLMLRLQEYPSVIGDLGYRQLGTMAKRWENTGDLIFNDPLDLVKNRIVSNRAYRLGVKPMGFLKRGILNRLSAWKEQALMSPAFHAANLGTQIIMSGMHGVNVPRMLRNQDRMIRNLWNVRNDAEALRTGKYLPEDFKQYLDALGKTEAPASIRGGYNSALMEFEKEIQHTGQTAIEQIPAWERALHGAVQGLGWGPLAPVMVPANAAFGAFIVPHMARWNRLLTMGLESTARLSAWMLGSQRYLSGMVDPFIDDLVRDLGSTAWRVRPDFAPTTTRTIGRLDVNREIPLQVTHTQALVQEVQGLRQTHGVLSPQLLEQTLVKHGADPRLVNRYVKRWLNIQREADKAGTELANHINLNYSNLTNFEQWLKSITPFTVWAVRSLPFFAQHIAEHPNVAFVLGRYAMLSEREREELGLPERFRGTVNLGEELARVLFPEKLYPAGTQFRFNPFSRMLPEGMVGGVREAADEAGPLGQLGNTLEAYGLGPGPWIDVGLSNLSALSEAAGGPAFYDQPTPRLFRLTPTQRLVGDYLGVPADPELVYRSILEAPQRILGKEPFNHDDYAARKKLVELALRETGMPDHPDYLGAMANPASPLYRRALLEARYQGDFASAMAFSGMPSVQAISTEELAIRGARVQAPKGEGYSEELAGIFEPTLAAKNPLYGAYGPAYGPARGAPQIGQSSPLDFETTAPQALLQEYVAWARAMGLPEAEWWRKENVQLFQRARARAAVIQAAQRAGVPIDPRTGMPVQPIYGLGGR